MKKTELVIQLQKRPHRLSLSRLSKIAVMVKSLADVSGSFAGDVGLSLLLCVFLWFVSVFVLSF
jgi:hypothetical protein